MTFTPRLKAMEEEEMGSSNASRAAMGPPPHVAPEAEPSAAWRPMSTIREVRDGRPVLLRFEGDKPISRAFTLLGAVVGHWAHGENEWFLADDSDDLTSGLGAGLIDDDFTGWAPLPDLSRQEIAAMKNASGLPVHGIDPIAFVPPGYGLDAPTASPAPDRPENLMTPNPESDRLNKMERL